MEDARARGPLTICLKEETQRASLPKRIAFHIRDEGIEIRDSQGLKNELRIQPAPPLWTLRCFTL